MSLDPASIRRFWEARAREPDRPGSYSVTNLEEDRRLEELKVRLEREHVFAILPLAPSMRVLDLGAGIGAWSFEFARRCREVVAIEYSQEMIERAKRAAAEQSCCGSRRAWPDDTRSSTSTPRR